mmetsp:Transcript_9885/g.28111  ORF Transcript_9885/g.28111 Transcript_9885/m.28111 type:complete len:288 (+) Transcript_9885:427-1290(+)
MAVVLVVVATPQPLAPLGVVRLEAEGLDVGDPLRSLLERVRQHQIQHLVGSRVHRLHFCILDLPKLSAKQVQNLLDDVGFPKHHLARLFLQQQASHNKQRLNSDIGVLPLLAEEVGQQTWNLGRGQQQDAILVQGQSADQNDALQQHVVLGEADHQQPVQQLQQPGCAQVGPCNLVVRGLQGGQSADRLDEDVGAVAAPGGQVDQLAQPVVVAAPPRPPHDGEEALPEAAVRGRLAEHLQHHWVGTLDRAHHRFRETGGLHQHSATSLVGCEIQQQRRRLGLDVALS